MSTQLNNHFLASKKVISVLVSLSFAVSMGSFAMDIYIPFIPFIGEELCASAHQVQWTLSIFMAFMALGQLFIGPLSDKYGRKNLLLISSIIFTLGSMLAASTSKISFFLLARALQAIGSCGCYAVSIAYVQEHFEGKQVEKFLSAFVCLNGLGPIFAPILGTKLGILFHSWRASFVYLAITGLFSVSFIWRFLETKNEKDKHSSLPSLQEIKGIFFHEHFQRWFLVLATVMTGLFTFFSLSTYYLQETLGYSMYTYSALFGLQGMIYTFGSLSRNIFFSNLSTETLTLLGMRAIRIFALILCLHPLFPGKPAIIFLICSYAMAYIYGLILGPSTALLLRPFTKRAGTAAALCGSLQFFIAPAMASFFVIPPIESGFSYGAPLLLLSSLALYKIGSRETLKDTVSL